MTEMTSRAVMQRPSEPLLPRWWRTVDKLSLAAAVALFLVGLMLSMAASPWLADRNGLPQFYYVLRQAQFGALALIVMLGLSALSPTAIRRWATLGCLGVILALIALPWLGTDFGKGAVRWYSLGFASIQPSEFLKPLLIVTFAWLMSASFDRRGPPGLTLSFVLAVVVAVLLALQPDFGQAALVMGVWGLMYFVAGAPVFLLVAIAGGALGTSILAYNNSEHFRRRIDGFLSTEIDPTTQIGHAASAIREGGLFGVGVGGGEIKRTLPDAHTDFIIAVAAEEYGLILCLLIIALFVFVTARGLLSLLRVRDPFVRLAGTGLAIAFGLQAIINMGVAVRLLPAKGMTLPLVSYGGSSVLAVGIGLGMLLAFTRRRPVEDLEEHFGAVA